MKAACLKLGKCISVDDEVMRQFLADALISEYIMVEICCQNAVEGSILVPAGEQADPQPLAKALSEVCCREKIDFVFLEDSSYNREVAAYLAICLNCKCLTEVQRVEIREGRRYFVREAYQANMYAGYPAESPLVLTLKSQTGKMQHMAMPNTVIQVCADRLLPVPVLSREKNLAGRPHFCEDTILICGYGIGSRENAELAVKIAGESGFGIGATRPVVTSGWLPAEYLVGISGNHISPQNCIVLGASGSQAFMAGIADSKKIIAVNTDKSAPVFWKCDVGITEDCMKFLKRLAE